MAQGDIRFDGRVILITGAGRGIGRAQALLLAARGARVVVADNGTTVDGVEPSAKPSESVVAEIQRAGGDAVAYTADLATETGATGAVEATVNRFGRIDGLLHNASTVPSLTTTDKLSSHDLEVVMRINPFAAFWLTRAAWPHMVAQKYGRIVYMSSGGIFGGAGTAPYCAAKAAIVGITRCVAPEGTSNGILVNAVAPSAYTRMTARHPSAAYREWSRNTMPAEKVAVGTAYLMSEVCNITGEVFSMGGGYLSCITLAESEAVLGSGASIEETGDLLTRVMAEDRFVYPKSSAERSARIAALFAAAASPS